MESTNNSVGVSTFSVGMNEFQTSQTQEAEPANDPLDKVFDPAGCHFSVGDGTKKSALDSALIYSIERMSKLMLDYLPKASVTSQVTSAAIVAKHIDGQEGLSAFLLRELVVKKIVPIVLTSGVAYGTSQLVQSIVLDPLGLLKDEGFVGSGLNVAEKWILGKGLGAAMPEYSHGGFVNDLSRMLISREDLHSGLLNYFSRSIIDFAVDNSLVPGEAIKSFSGKLMGEWIREKVE